MALDKDFLTHSQHSDIAPTIWKPTKTNGEWAKFDEIEAEIREKLKPENGFQTMIGELRYSVKINPDNSIFCFRNPIKRRANNGSDINQPNKLQTYFHLQKDINPIENIKVIPLDDFQKLHLKEQWRISETNHLCIFGNKLHVILLKRGKLFDFEEETTKNKEAL